MSLASILGTKAVKGGSDLASMLRPKKSKATPVVKVKKSKQQQVEASNTRARAQLKSAGAEDPTRPQPTLIERILTPLQAGQQAASSLIHGLVNEGFKGNTIGFATSDEERAKGGGGLIVQDKGTGEIRPFADPIKAFTDALGGKTTVQGEDVVGDLEKRLGFDTPGGAFGQGAAGLAYDVATDWLTYVTMGLTHAGKSAARSAIAEVAEDGVSVGTLKSMGLADDAIAHLVATYGDDAGRIIIDGMPRAVQNDLFARISIASANDINKGRGVLGVAGELGDKAQYGLTRASLFAKEAPRAVPGVGKVADWLDTAFAHGSAAAGTKNLGSIQRVGYEMTKRKLGGRLSSAEHAGVMARELIESNIPDARTRGIVSVGISRVFGDTEKQAALQGLASAKDDALDTLKSALKSKDGAVVTAAQNAADTASQRFSEAVSQAYDPAAVTRTLQEFGITDTTALETAQKASENIADYMGELLKKQERAGAPLADMFGAGGKGYLPGMASVPRQGKTLKNLIANATSDREVYNATMTEMGDVLGFDPAELRQSSSFKEFFRRVVAPSKGQAKKYLNPEARLEDIARGTTEAGAKGGISTETDVAKLVAKATTQAEGRIALADFQKSVRNITSDPDTVRLLSLAEESFTNDAATSGFLKVFDAAQGLFKKQATVWRMPAFQLRNKGSNVWLMGLTDSLDAEAWARSPFVMLGKDKGTFKIGEKVIAADDLLDMARGLGVIAGRGRQELYSNQVQSGLTRAGAWINSNLVEDADRLSVFVSGLRKGLDPEGAAHLVDATLYSYDPVLLTSFERNVMRRLAPFYIWQRRNLPHMAEALVKRPGFMSAVIKAQRNMADAYGIDESILPEWQKAAGYIAMGAKDNPTLLSVQGVLPVGDLSDTPSLAGFVSKMSPLIKDPLVELPSNWEAFSDQPLETYAGEKRKSPGIVQALDRLLGGLERPLIGAEERINPVTGESFVATNNRYFNKIVRDASPFLGQVGKVASPKDEYELTSGLTGFRGYAYDTPQLLRSKAYDDQAALQNLLTRLKAEGRIGKKVTVKKAKKKKSSSLAQILGGK